MNETLLKQWTDKALAHKDGHGRPIETSVVTKEQPSFPKDANGQVIIPSNISNNHQPLVKSVWKQNRMTSPFENQPVVNAMTGF